MKKALLASLILAARLPLAAGDLHGKLVCVGISSCEGAVIYIGAIPGSAFTAPPQHPRIDQIDQAFRPHVLAVQAGTTIDFYNSDPVRHNVFTPDACAERMDLGLWSQGETRSYTYKAECVVTLLCKVHHDMVAFVVVSPTPYYAMVQEDGSFRISNLPDGAYTVKFWHEKLRLASKAVTVAGLTESSLVLAKK
jgi:hypothetical protein